jgi:AraC family transcriptional activator of pobA
MMRREAVGGQEIPRFFLYGEAPREARGRFLHLEPLDDRSRPNNWTIRPHAHADLNHIFFITAGAGEMRTDSGTFPLAAPALLIVPARAVHGFRWQPETEGHVLTVADAYLHELIRREPEFAELFQAPDRPALPGEPDEIAHLALCMHGIAFELARSAPARQTAIEVRFLELLVWIRRLQRPDEAAADPQLPGRHAKLVARFRQVVDDHFNTKLQISDYAERLGSSVAQLRFACLKVARRTPLDILQERLFVEAKQRLLYTNTTIAEIGYQLGFDDPAYFTRFFTRHAGQSPRSFRRHHDGNDQ